MKSITSVRHLKFSAEKKFCTPYFAAPKSVYKHLKKTHEWPRKNFDILPSTAFESLLSWAFSDLQSLFVCLKYSPFHHTYLTLRLQNRLILNQLNVWGYQCHCAPTKQTDSLMPRHLGLQIVCHEMGSSCMHKPTMDASSWIRICHYLSFSSVQNSQNWVSFHSFVTNLDVGEEADISQKLDVPVVMGL